MPIDLMMASTSQSVMPNPQRVAAGRRNRALRLGLTDAGRQRLRESAVRCQPWRSSTGPKSAEGKLQSVKNGKVRQKGVVSVRERNAVAAELAAELLQLQACWKQVVGDSAEKSLTPN